ncbi:MULTISPECIES: prepilin-type N-terminal cleavage/methylation domain-containing protein [unclassified Erwinia]|uniref:prepilin-type N-terminal cleavage/methylation domain-containing protein n=1 Tax=unclassified Erwinia TaxID=2622719 RepID=UPI000C199DF2|nr:MULTISPECIES: prepilin-type N-terminal cleavage/methylation domain-containing protein [unclassified Erwinia]
MSQLQRGFTLPEVLLALLLMTMTLCLLLRSQLMITQGFSWQWQQREQWQALRQRLQGPLAESGRIELQRRPVAQGCQLYLATTHWQQKEMRLKQLICTHVTP